MHESASLCELIGILESIVPAEVEFTRTCRGNITMNLRSTEDRSLVRRMAFGDQLVAEAWLRVEIKNHS